MQNSNRVGLKCVFLAALFVTRSQLKSTGMLVQQHSLELQLADGCLVVMYVFTACIMHANKPVIASAGKIVHLKCECAHA